MSDEAATITTRNRGEPPEGLLADVLAEHGFTDVTRSSNSRMRFVHAKCADGSPATFWLKVDWTSGQGVAAAAAFGLGGSAAEWCTEDFCEHVERLAAKAKQLGAQFLLLVQAWDGHLFKNWAVLRIDDVSTAYRRQQAVSAKRTRNGTAAQLWFHAEPSRLEAECAQVVRDLSVPLRAISGVEPLPKVPGQDMVRVWQEMELRKKQDAFRKRVGARSGWKCAVSGLEVREVLEAAHLPGRDWRQDNDATDGIMLRVDLHRLLDRGLAQLRDGRFWIAESARSPQYAEFHGKSYLDD